MSTLLTMQESSNVAIVFKYGDEAQAIISSVNNMKLAGRTRNAIDVVVFREEPRQFAGAKQRTPMTFSAVTVLSDPGQLLLSSYFENNTAFGPVGHANGHCRIYYDLPELTEDASLLTNNFRTLDTARDSLGTYKISGLEPQPVDPNGMFSFDSGFYVSGREADFYVHKTATTIAIVAGGGGEDTITDSGNGFVSAGFTAGQTLIIEGSTADDGIYLIKTVEAGTITLTTTTVTGEIATASITLHGGK